jgi:Cdc6-like AAA superfamily ATPase
VLIIAARTGGGPDAIEEMDRELSNVIEDFDRAVNVEALRLVKETGKHLSSQAGDIWFSVIPSEQQFLLERLDPIRAGYDLDHLCMEGTRQSILNEIVSWVADPQEVNDAPRKNAYWVYGSPGIGKTSLAHSICASIHDREQLAGAFFCRRDDPNLSKPRNILPTLINKLAGIFPPFRTTVANRLRNDPNLSPESMKGSLFLDFIHDLPRQPKHTLVFVIDALDECGDDQSRPGLLKVLIDAAAHAPWLKIIITSRPEVDIEEFLSSSCPVVIFITRFGY